MPRGQNHAEKLRSRYVMPRTQLPTVYEDLPNQLHRQAVPVTHAPPPSPHLPPHPRLPHTHHLPPHLAPAHTPPSSTHTPPSHTPSPHTHDLPTLSVTFSNRPPPHTHHSSPCTTTSFHPSSLQSDLSSLPPPPPLLTVTFSSTSPHTCTHHKLRSQQFYLFCGPKFHSREITRKPCS